MSTNGWSGVAKGGCATDVKGEKGGCATGVAKEDTLEKRSSISFSHAVTLLEPDTVYSDPALPQDVAKPAGRQGSTKAAAGCLAAAAAALATAAPDDTF